MCAPNDLKPQQQLMASTLSAKEKLAEMRKMMQILEQEIGIHPFSV
jgi:hypothetical protein